MRAVIIAFLFVSISLGVQAQCCSGGAGSPVAGGTSQGVLMENQFEINTNFQFVSSNQFYTHDVPDTNKYFESFSSLYQYFRLAYGVSERLTVSLESGSFFKKEEIGLYNDPERTYRSSGFSDLILFPRYQLFKHLGENSTTEGTMGIGIKFPVGHYNDSTERIEPFSGDSYYVTNPQAVQPTSGAIDILLYGFLIHQKIGSRYKFFMNMMYIRKGWNPLGEKTGDYASVGLFASGRIIENMMFTLQCRGELMGKTTVNENVLMFGGLNYDPEATGYKKVFLAPQLSYTYKGITAFVLTDIPLYQYLTKTQVGSQFQITGGLSYRFGG